MWLFWHCGPGWMFVLVDGHVLCMIMTIPLFPRCLEQWDLPTRTAILAYSLSNFPTLPPQIRCLWQFCWGSVPENIINVRMMDQGFHYIILNTFNGHRMFLFSWVNHLWQLLFWRNNDTFQTDLILKLCWIKLGQNCVLFTVSCCH